VRSDRGDLDVGFPAAEVEPGNADADASADYRGDGDVGWKMMAGRHPLDPNAAGNQCAYEPGQTCSP